MRDFAVDVRSTLSNATACLNTFTGTNLSAGSTAVTTIKDEANANKFVGGTAYMGGILNFKNLVMQDFVADAVNPNKGRAKLYVYADKTGQASGVATVHHVLSVQIEMNAAQDILKCIAVGGLSDSLWQVSTTNPNDIFFNGGKVGIGTINPTHTLHISGNSSGFGYQTGAQIGDVGTGNGPLFLIHNAPEIGGNVYYDSGSKYGGGMGKPALIDLAFGIKFYTSNNPVGAAGTPVADLTERMRIDSNGNVGIGTTSPSAKLEISQGTIRTTIDNTWGIFLANTFSNNPSHNSVFAGLRARGTESSSSYPVQGDVLGGITFRDALDGLAGSHISTYGGAEMLAIVTEPTMTTAKKGTAFAIFTTSNGTATPLESMRIDHNGNVGIGTTTPTTKLEVNGNVRALNLWKCLCNGDKSYMFGLDGNVDAAYGSMIFYEDISATDCYISPDRPGSGHYSLVCTQL